MLVSTDCGAAAKRDWLLAEQACLPAHTETPQAANAKLAATQGVVPRSVVIDFGVQNLYQRANNDC